MARLLGARAPWAPLSWPLPGALGASASYVVRLAGKSETLLDETIRTLRAAQPVLTALAAAVEDGLLEELREAVGRLDEALGLVRDVAVGVDRSLPVIDDVATQVGRTVPMVEEALASIGRVMPVIEAMPATQDDVRIAREAAQHMEGLVNATLEQLVSLPGARLVRRRLDRVAGTPAVGPPARP